MLLLSPASRIYLGLSDFDVLLVLTLINLGYDYKPRVLMSCVDINDKTCYNIIVISFKARGRHP